MYVWLNEFKRGSMRGQASSMCILLASALIVGESGLLLDLARIVKGPPLKGLTCVGLSLVEFIQAYDSLRPGAKPYEIQEIITKTSQS